MNANNTNLRSISNRSDSIVSLVPLAGLADEKSHRAEPSARVAPKLNCINWDALNDEIPERTWWIPEWLSPAPTLFAGAGGKGKSMIMQAICTSLATGRDYIASVAQPVRCLMWSCEDDQWESLRRQQRLNKFFGLKPSDLANLRMCPRAGEDNVLYHLGLRGARATPLLRMLSEQVNDERADVLVLDNISQVYGGQSADAHQVTSFVNSVAGLVKDRPFAPIFIGHVARTPGSEFAGSAAWENAVRMRWHLGSTQPTDNSDEGDQFDPDTLYMSRRKSNYSSIGYIAMSRVDGIPVPASHSARVAEKLKRMEKVDDVVLAGLRALLSRGAGSTEHMLVRDLIAKGLAGDAKKHELEASLQRMLSDGRLVLGCVGKYVRGTDKIGPMEPGSAVKK